MPYGKVNIYAKLKWWIRRRRIDAAAKRATYRNGRRFKKFEGNTTCRDRLEWLPAPQPIESPQAGAQLMLRDGFIQFPDLLSPEQVTRLRQHMDEIAGADDRYQTPKSFYQRHLLLDMQHDPIWLPLLDPSPAFDVIELILGGDCLLTSACQWVTGDGREMEMHIDDLLPEEYYRDPEPRFPICPVTLQYYLDDQVEEIGPTAVIPGSHRAGRWPRGESAWNGIRPQMVCVKAGGALMFRHDLWHGAIRNRSPRRRYMLQMHYAPAHARPSAPPTALTTDIAPEVLERFTDRHRRLLRSVESPVNKPLSNAEIARFS